MIDYLLYAIHWSGQSHGKAETNMAYGSCIQGARGLFRETSDKARQLSRLRKEDIADKK